MSSHALPQSRPQQVNTPTQSSTIEVAPHTPAVLLLADGRTFYGNAIGYKGYALGEVVFNTAMTGYQEIMTDPSYRQQMVTFTYPHIGNYGIHLDDNESMKPQVSGIIVRTLCRTPSHERSLFTLGTYLAQSKISGIEGIDTRSLVRHIRSKGTQVGIIYHADENDLEHWPLSEDKKIELQKKVGDYGQQLDWAVARQTGIKRPYTLEADPKSPLADHPLKVVVYDFGVKQGILNRFRSMGCRVSVVPPTFPAQALLDLQPDGVFISNGPGDPTSLDDFIPQIKKLIGKTPIFGICLGHQLLALAMGAKIEKMVFGHRGANHPVICLHSGVVEITSQNHGFTVIESNLPSHIQVSHRNLNDQSIEGIMLPDAFAFSVQYHPESCPGPHDARRHFQRFIHVMQAFKQGRSFPYA